MTDKEKAEAEEYAIAICFNCKKNIAKNACNRENYENCCNYVNSYFGFYHGYKAGLAEGRRPEWHDLRKNPDDVPAEKGDYWVIDADGDYSLISNFVNTTHGDTATLFKAHGAIAWCELPKFEDKEE